MSGQAPYGYKLEPHVMDGINTKRLVVDLEAAEQVKLMFEMYAEPETSFGDIARYFIEKDIDTNGKNIYRSALSYLLKNPSYAQADLNLYEFFKSQGANVVNDAADFTGTNGCYLFQGQGVTESKRCNLNDQILVIAPHEGLVSSEVWLKCRRKLMKNRDFGDGQKVKNTWLSGKTKCGRCGTALVYTKSPKVSYAYLRCRKRTENLSCEGCGTLHVHVVEASIYNEMVRKLNEFQILTNGNPAKANPKLTAYHVELAQVDADIEKLVSSLLNANTALISMVNQKAEELENKRQSLVKAIAEMTADTFSPKQLDRISGYLADWDNVSIEDKRFVVDGLISQINATSESIDIDWKI